MKTCSKCTIEKPYSDFPPAGKVQSRDGYRSWCRQCFREYTKRYRQENPEKTKESVRQWFVDHPGYRSNYMKQWHAENQDKELAWYQANKARRAADARRRRAKVLAVENTLTNDEWLQIVEFYSGLCFYCGKPWEEMDHFIPFVLGGGNTSDNVVPACMPCNRSKGGKHPDEFISIIGGAYYGPFDGRNLPTGSCNSS